MPIGASGIHRRRGRPNFSGSVCISGWRVIMLNLPNSNILLCVEPTDMRKSFDSLAILVQSHLGGDPLSGSWFVFHGKKNDRLKTLYWDRDGYAMWYKRLGSGTSQFPIVTRNMKSVEVSTYDLSLILDGIDLGSVRRRKRFKLTEPVSGWLENTLKSLPVYMIILMTNADEIG